MDWIQITIIVYFVDSIVRKYAIYLLLISIFVVSLFFLANKTTKFIQF